MWVTLDVHRTYALCWVAAATGVRPALGYEPDPGRRQSAPIRMDSFFILSGVADAQVCLGAAPARLSLFFVDFLYSLLAFLIENGVRFYGPGLHFASFFPTSISISIWTWDILWATHFNQDLSPNLGVGGMRRQPLNSHPETTPEHV